jgi:hypothetical protein
VEYNEETAVRRVGCVDFDSMCDVQTKVAEFLAQGLPLNSQSWLAQFN